MSDGYASVVRDVARWGTVESPRGIRTREVLNASVILEDPTLALPIGVGRQINTKIAAVEALQLMGGVLHPELLVAASPMFRNYMDGGTFHGGYGQRIRSQLPAVVKRLQHDGATRQAVLTIWDPLHDLFTEGVRDYPCTLALQFMVRDGALVMHTHMRSNDVWRGLAYDVFVFTQLQLIVAAALSVPVGRYYHHTSSLHIYESDVPDVEALISSDTSPRVGALVRVGTSIANAMHVARCVLLKVEGLSPHADPEVGTWYAERVP